MEKSEWELLKVILGKIRSAHDSDLLCCMFYRDYAETPVPSAQRPTSSFQTSATTRRPLSNTKFVRPSAQKPARLAPIQSDTSKTYTVSCIR